MIKECEHCKYGCMFVGNSCDCSCHKQHKAEKWEEEFDEAWKEELFDARGGDESLWIEISGYISQNFIHKSELRERVNSLRTTKNFACGHMEGRGTCCEEKSLKRDALDEVLKMLE